MGFKTKILLQLLFPLLVFVVFLLFSVTTGTKNSVEVKDIAEMKESVGYSLDGLKAVFMSYLFSLTPHFFAIILSNPLKSKKIVLPLLTITNIFLVAFVSLIIILKYLHYRDLSLLWIFYIPASMVVILISWFLVKEYKKGK